MPLIEYPAELPVSARREDIANAIRDHQVVVICGETGSGKTTQLPKICLEVGRGLNGYIGHTQPRRLAARTVATRIAEELNVPMGQQVGYKIRFGDQTSPDTLVKLMTDGILLAETQTDRLLRQYDTIIIDEAHERSLNIDFLLGYLKQILPRRPDLKIIITSATIDPQRFSKHFNDCPIIEVSGRTYPVDVVYHPLISEDDDEVDIHEIDAIRDSIHQLNRIGQGDILIFFPTERDIRETMEVLEGDKSIQADLLPLFSRLSNDQQIKVFHPDGKRQRIILSTNVAETSVTVPGIRYVIDTGLARISRYSPRTKVQRLPVERISQASANQRKGRCGRLGPGICVRLYSEKDFTERAEFTDPEILRTNLASVILQMKALNLGNIQEFPFIDPPDHRLIRDGLNTLHEIGAIDEEDNLTDIGRRLSKLPVDPRVARMILGGQDEHCEGDVLIIAAALSTQDLRERPADQSDAADQAHAQFKDEQSDFITLLKLWRNLREKQDEVSNNQFRKWCKQNFLSFMRYREWIDIYYQLCDQSGFRSHRPTHVQTGGSTDPWPIGRRDAIHRAILPGLLSNIAMKTDAAVYTGARGSKVSIFPGSSLFKSRPLWIMAAELVETTKLYARMCGPVKTDWVERFAKHLVTRTYSEPHWNKQTGNVVAFEKVTLFGLLLVPKRTVNYGAIDPRLSRELFIHHALVENDFRTDCPALLKNRELIASFHLWQHKLRRNDLLADHVRRFEFFEQRIPRDVFSGTTFEQWRRRGDGSNWHVLELTARDLLREGCPDLVLSDYPDHLALDTLKVPLHYVYDPGAEDDGITAVVPLTALAQVPDTRAEWLVPGRVLGKVEELIRALPKKMRIQFVPANETAKKVHAALPAFGTGSLIDATAGILWKMSGEPISRSVFQLDQLPLYLSMNYRVIDAQGATVAEGRDLPELRAKLGQKVRATFSSFSDPRYTRDNITSWNFGDLPEKVPFDHHGALIYGYPTLIEVENTVSLRLLDSRQSSDLLMPMGLRRLYMIETAKDLRLTLRDLPNIEQLRLAYRPFGTGDELEQDVTLLVADRAFFNPAGSVLTKDDFAKKAGEAWKRMYEVSRAYGKLIGDILERHRTINSLLARNYPPLLLDNIEDMRSQFKEMFPKRFLTQLPADKLEYLPRYLKAIDTRLSRLTNAGLTKDLSGLMVIRPLWMQYLERTKMLTKRGLSDAATTEYRWLLEELRVSLFAQELKTTIPISTQKLDTFWKERVLTSVPGVRTYESKPK